MFVNRESELATLLGWWEQPGSSLALLWGRRRVGKTALLQTFSQKLPTVFHTAAGRPVADELRLLSEAAARVLDSGLRDLVGRPFVDWDDALEFLASVAEEPLLLVLDEFPELVARTSDLPGILRAFWDRAQNRTNLRVLLCGSAVRSMTAMQEERAPLYGRFDLALQLHPFRPHEAAQMLTGLEAADRALVFGLIGGMPLYLEWWDQDASLHSNLLRLAASPGGKLLTEGQLVLATEGDTGELSSLILRSIAAGRTRYGEIAQAVGAQPARTLDRLIELGLVERLVPVTEREARTRRRVYRIADNFLAFWLGVLDRYRSAIERGLGSEVIPTLVSTLDDHMGERWESTFRAHLMRLATKGELGANIVDVGRFWRDRPPTEIDAVVLAGRRREAVLVGEAKWARRANAGRILRQLEEKAAALPRRASNLRYAVAARESVSHSERVLAVTAKDIFGV
ncbi:MAG: ATP-binding protein [Acidimicrobiia bacterium]|nr:ATP-binding protein [Acidimicrobiia bacterium]